jgi:hypothetical protein
MQQSTISSIWNTIFAALLDSDSEDDDDNNLAVGYGAVVGYYAQLRTFKKHALFHVWDRLEWLQHVQQLNREGAYSFQRLYRMDYQSFTHLCEIIRPAITKDANKRCQQKMPTKDANKSFQQKFPTKDANKSFQKKKMTTKFSNKR